MKVVGINPIHLDKHLNLFHFQMDDGRVYEVCSRKRVPDPLKCDAADVIAFNSDKSKVLVVKEYRPPVQDYIYAFPAGLCDSDERYMATAHRELYEECGLVIFSVNKILKPAFQSPGMSDESVATIICTVEELEPTNKNCNADEDIQAMWLTKGQAVNLLKAGKPMSARCQIVLAIWSGYLTI